MSYSSGSGSSTYSPNVSTAQNAQMNAAAGLYTGTIAPAYQQYGTGAGQLYNASAGGVNQAASNLAGTAAQAQNVLGTGGESAYNTGISGLENLFTPEYQQQQLQAALQPGEAQYAQNIAQQQAQFGGAGQLGSSRSALAQQQTAAATQAAQQQAAAQVMNNIATQQQNAAGTLLNAGQTGLTGAQTAAQNQLTASQAPMSYYQQLGQAYSAIPSSVYTPNVSGTVGSTTNQTGSQAGVNASSGLGAALLGGGIAALLS